MAYTVNNLSLKMIQDNLQSTETTSAQPLLARADFIFTAAALSVVTALLLPLPVKIIDILWTCSLCLTTAVLLISLLAKNSSELAQLPILIVVSTLIRIALCTASARFILLAGSGGIILETTAKSLTATGLFWTIVISLLTAMLALLLIHKAASSITKSSLNFTTQILPLKNIGLETDLNAGLIDSKQAENLRLKIDRETQFYLDMAGVARLLRCDVIIAAIIVIVALISQIAIAAIDKSNITASIQVYSSLIAAASLLTFLPALLAASALAYLLGKTSLTLKTNTSDTDQQPAQTIEIVSQQTGRTEEVQLLNPNFVKAAKHDTSTDHAQENIADFEPVETTQPDSTKTNPPNIPEKFDSMDQYYDSIAQCIDDSTQADKTLLLAAENTTNLPVTVAVNTAIRLAKTKYRTLIVDADFERNSVAKAFDVQPDKTKTKTVRTAIENLFICTCRRTAGREQSNLALIVKKAAGTYDKVIIYAPNINANSALMFAEIADRTIIFADRSDNQICRQLELSTSQPPIVMPPAKNAV
jgi:hypothetical protein